MSTMSDALAAGLAALATVKGDALTYCATYGGSYAALTGFVIHVDRVEPVQQSDARNIEEQVEGATVKGPTTPLMVRGYFIKDTLNSDRIWYVESVKIDQQQILKCRRTNQLDATPNRGARR